MVSSITLDIVQPGISPEMAVDREDVFTSGLLFGTWLPDISEFAE